jgi:hypothetical protein
VATRRCSLCGINYPIVVSIDPLAALCPLHEEPMEYRPDQDPDDDWHEKSQEIAKRITQELEDGASIPDLDSGALFTDNGRQFIYSWDVVKRGIGHRLSDGTLLRVHTTVYEVLGYVDALRAYWVIEFPMHLSDEALAALATPPKKGRKKKS